MGGVESVGVGDMLRRKRAGDPRD
jgi:hypothetical protein